MSLPSGTLKLKGVPSAEGNSIVGEVMGSDFTGTARLLTIMNNTDPDLSPAPIAMTDFQSYVQSWGRMFYERTAGSATSTIQTVETGTEAEMTQVTETEAFTFTRNENSLVFKDDIESVFTAGDITEAWYYRRTKQTGGGWTTSNTWLSGAGYYLSQVWGENADDHDQKWELNSCLLEGTKLFVRKDTTLLIEKLIVGMEVYTEHEETGEMGLFKVLKVEKVPVKSYFHIIFEDGSEIRCSHGHRFMIPKGAVQERERPSDEKLGRIMAAKVEEGTVIYHFDKEWNKKLLKVKSAKYFDTTLAVYKLEVENAHTMISDNGIFHHNDK